MEIFPVSPKSPSEMYAIPRNEPACSFALSLIASFPARCNYRVSQSEDQRCRFLGSHRSRGAPIVFRARAHTRSSRSSFSIIRIISSGFVPRVHSNSIELSLKSSASLFLFPTLPLFLACTILYFHLWPFANVTDCRNLYIWRGVTPIFKAVGELFGIEFSSVSRERCWHTCVQWS